MLRTNLCTNLCSGRPESEGNDQDAAPTRRRLAQSQKVLERGESMQVTIQQNHLNDMKPRCTWSGHLKISLVIVPVRVYTAISTTERITFHQLHKSCHHRIKQKLVCPVHGEVAREDLVKGYEYCPEKFVILDEADLQAVHLETTGTIEVVQFARPEELDPMFLDTPYYLGPDGPVAEQGFTIMREAMRRTKRIGIGRVVLSGKERPVALKPHGKGFVFFTLRYVSEVRQTSLYFEDIPDQPVEADQLALAHKLIEKHSSPLNLAGFTDRYQTTLLEVIKAKVEGTGPPLLQPNATSQIVNLMEALQQSLAKVQRKPHMVASARTGRKASAAA